MPKVNISEAAKLAGITRQYLHKKYIKTGTITVEKDHAGNPQIDTTEILRVFGKLHGASGDSSQSVNSYHDITAINDSKNTALQTEIHVLREQLSAAAEREKWMQGKVDQLADQLASTTRLLEHKETITKKDKVDQEKGMTAILAAELDRAKVEAAQLAQTLAAERGKGFFARLFRQ